MRHQSRTRRSDSSYRYLVPTIGTLLVTVRLTLFLSIPSGQLISSPQCMKSRQFPTERVTLSPPPSILLTHLPGVSKDGLELEDSFPWCIKHVSHTSSSMDLSSPPLLEAGSIDPLTSPTCPQMHSFPPILKTLK